MITPSARRTHHAKSGLSQCRCDYAGRCVPFEGKLEPRGRFLKFFLPSLSRQEGRLSKRLARISSLRGTITVTNKHRSMVHMMSRGIADQASWRKQLQRAGLQACIDDHSQAMCIGFDILGLLQTGHRGQRWCQSWTRALGCRMVPTGAFARCGTSRRFGCTAGGANKAEQQGLSSEASCAAGAAVAVLLVAGSASLHAPQRLSLPLYRLVAFVQPSWHQAISTASVSRWFSVILPAATARRQCAAWLG